MVPWSVALRDVHEEQELNENLNHGQYKNDKEQQAKLHGVVNYHLKCSDGEQN